VKLLDDPFDIFRGFLKRLHRSTNLTGSESVLHRLLCCVEKDNVLGVGFFRTTRGAAKNARACDGGNKHAFVLGVAFSDCVVLFLKCECCHKRDHDLPGIFSLPKNGHVHFLVSHLENSVFKFEFSRWRNYVIVRKNELGLRA